MSITVLSRVFWTDFKDLSYTKKTKIIRVGAPAAKLVMLAIADNADDFGENSWQSFETLATKANIERRSVIRAIDALKANSFLSINGISRYGTNDYKINLDKLGRAPDKRDRVGRPKTSDSPVTNYKTGDSDAQISDSDAETSDSYAKTSDSGSPESSFNRSFNRPLKQMGAKAPDASKLPLEWKLTHGIPVTDEDFQNPEAAALQDRINAYPPDVQQVLTWLVEIFAWPSVPARPARESKGGAYALWINDLRDIDKIIAGHGRKALEAAYRVWDQSRFTVSHPGALYSTIFDQVSRLNKTLPGKLPKQITREEFLAAPFLDIED